MKRYGFTLIELIFVIVLIGILASVALPKFMGLRTNAKAVTTAQEVQSAVDEIRKYVTLQGRVDNLDTMSKVIATLKDKGKATVNTKNATIKTPDDDGNLEDCIKMEVNATTLAVTHVNSSDMGAICTKVQEKIKDANYTIGGRGMEF